MDFRNKKYLDATGIAQTGITDRKTFEHKGVYRKVG